MTSITRTLTLSLSVAAAAIFFVLLSIVIWLDVARERELTFCQAAAAILDRATVVDPGRELTIRSTDGIRELKSNSPNLWYVVSYNGLMAEFGRELRPALPFSLPYTGPIGFSVLNTLDQKSSFCLAVVRSGASELVMIVGGAQVRFGQIVRSFVGRNLFPVLLLAIAFALTVATGAFLSARFVARSIERVTRLALAIEPTAPQAPISLDEVPSELKPLDDRFHETGIHGTGSVFVDSSFEIVWTRNGIMATWRQAVELAMTEEEIGTLTALSRSRTEPASRVSRAAMLLAYREDPSFFAVGRRLGAHHQTVQRCVERAVAYGALAALDDRPRPGKEPVITPEAKAWLVSLACDKAKEHGYPHELWTTRLLARHAREHGPEAGHGCLAHLVQGTVSKILGQEEIKPHKVRYYLERRDAEFEQKMAEILCVYREVQVLKRTVARSKKPGKRMAIISYDEKPGIQAIATTAPDLPPVPGVHPAFARDFEYRRHGTLSLLAGIDLLTGKVHALVKDRHRSREFVEFLKLIDAAYPAGTAIKLILDNHSAHISKETRAWLDTRPAGRFEFTFTPKHGSWLNLIEGFFSKFARSVLRHIRVTSKHELKERIMAGIDDVNRHPVIHTWSYKLAEAA